jgi:hypothetical protein
MISMGSNSVSGILNSQANIYINADSDNDSSSGVIGFGFNRTGYTGGTEAMRILEDGNVGIGTTSPNRKLHVRSTDDTRGILIHNTSATSYAELHFSASREYRIGTGGSSSDSAALNNWYVYDLTAGAHRFTINSSGNVGIGTTSPSFRLSVQGIAQARGGVYVTQASPTNTLVLDADDTSFDNIFPNSTVNLSL